MRHEDQFGQQFGSILGGALGGIGGGVGAGAALGAGGAGASAAGLLGAGAGAAATGGATLAVPLALQGLKAGFGAFQAAKGAQTLQDVKQPTLGGSGAIQMDIREAEAAAREGLPAAQKREFVENVQRSGAGALKESASRRGGLAGLEGVVRGQSDAFRGLMAQDAASRQAKRADVQRARERMSEFSFRKFQVDKERAAAKTQSGQDILGAGLQNIFQGIDTAASFLV